MPKSVPPLVAHVIHRLDYGGLENGLLNLINRMPEDRYRHAIICLAGYNPGFLRRIRRSDTRVISLDKRPGKDLPAYGRMWRILRELRPAVVHTRNLGTIDMQWVAAAAGIRFRIHGEHGWEASDPKGTSPRGLFIRRACRMVIDRYVPMSQDIAGWLAREVRVAPSRIRQIYNGVDGARFSPSVRPDTDAIVLGTVGRLDPVKNQRALLLAARSIIDQCPDLRGRLRVTIVGDGPLRMALESEARSVGLGDQTTFTGARDDTPEQFRAMDVFVLPSLNEGISNTILEAMASGLPVVAGRVGGNAELVADGITGTLYDPEQADGLAAALLCYLRSPDLRRGHGSAGRERVVRNFSLEAMVRQYLDLYDELTTPRTGSHGGTTVARN